MRTDITTSSGTGDHPSEPLKDLRGAALDLDQLVGGIYSALAVTQLSAWPHAVRAVGAEGLHFHDLRHTGNHLAAVSGAGLRDLMARMGHDSERAALIYLHSSAERQRTLADEVGRMAAAELAKSKRAKPSGTLTAREPNGPDGPADGKSPDLRK